MISLRSKPADIPVSIQQVIHTISGNSSELKELYSRAFRNLTLSISDYLGIRDLIVFFPTYKDSYSLHISLLLLYHFLNNGSICLSLHTETLKELLTKFELTDIVEKVALEIRNFFLQNKESELWVEYYEANPNSIQLARQRLLILYEYNKKKYLYFQKYFFHAYQLKENIQERLHTESNIQLRDKEFRDFLSLEKSLPVYSLNREQSLACILSNYVNTLIISGGPGTGKTTIISRIIYSFLLKHPYYTENDILLTAPTGKAAQKLSDSITKNIEDFQSPLPNLNLSLLMGQTLHSVLKYKSYEEKFNFNRDNKLPFQLVIVDEVSMLDISMMNYFIEALSVDTQLILVGDKFQLPSVEAGAVLTDLLPKGEIIFSKKLCQLAKDFLNMNLNSKDERKSLLENKIVILNKSHRQKDSSAKESILSVAERINKGDNSLELKNLIYKEKLFMDANLSPIQHKTDFRDTYLLSNVSTNEVFTGAIYSIFDIFLGNELKELYQELVPVLENNSIYTLNTSPLKEKIIQYINVLENCKFLCALKKGGRGVNFVNKILLQYWKYRIGEENLNLNGLPLIISKNDYRNKLFNGNTGVGFYIQRTPYFLYINRGEIQFTPLQILTSYELAIAISIHKSQGSEYEDVTVLLPEEEGHSLLTRELLYTAITRAKKSAILISSESVLKSSIENQIIRETGFSVWENS